MVIKRLSIMLLAVLFLISISACDSNKNKNSDAGDNKGNSTLRIYYTNYDTEIPNALNIFKEKHKDITVEEKYFSDINEYKNKITMDILSEKAGRYINQAYVF
jgi:maltose-binding protein MalE